MAHATIVTVDGVDRILVQTGWNEHELIKRIPGASYKAKMWTVPLSWAAGIQLRAMLNPTWGTDLVDWVNDERGRRVNPALELREQIEPFGVNDLLFPNLYPFQGAGVQFLCTAESALLADEMGTGKTIQALTALRTIGVRNALPALVICPNSVKFNWATEAERWLPEAHVYVVAGGPTARRKIIEAAAVDPLALVTVNFEALRTHSRTAGYGSVKLARCKLCGGDDPKITEARCETHIRPLNLTPFRTVVIDEAHRIKDPHAKQTRATWALTQGKTIERVYALTGTPIANDPSDLWSIMHAVAPLEYPTKTPYVERYCLLAWGAYGGLEVKGVHPNTRDEFFRILDPRFRRTPKALVLPQLPPKVRSRRYAELSPKQLKAYRDVDQTLVTRLPDGSVLVAPNDLAAKTRLLQLSSATLEQTPDGFRMCDPSSKIDVLLELLEELADNQVAVAAEHRQLIELAAARLDRTGITYGLYTGAQRDFERDVALRNFQEGKTRLLLFTLKAGGTGVTMTAADTMIFLQRSWSLIDNLQAEDRFHRIGSERHKFCHIIDIVAHNTVEEDQIERLWHKAERLEEITRDRARLRAAGGNTGELDAEEALLLATDLGG